MEDHPITHAKQVNALLSVTFTVVNPLNKKVIVERLNSLLEGDSVVTPICGSLVIIPYKLSHRVLITRSYVKCLWIISNVVEMVQCAQIYATSSDYYVPSPDVNRCVGVAYPPPNRARMPTTERWER